MPQGCDAGAATSLHPCPGGECPDQHRQYDRECQRNRRPEGSDGDHPEHDQRRELRHVLQPSLPDVVRRERRLVLQQVATAGIHEPFIGIPHRHLQPGLLAASHPQDGGSYQAPAHDRP